jgi:hypothetical protein
MNTMLEPRIVTASTYGCDDFAHGDAAVPHRTTPLSQGCITMFAKADPHQFPSRIMRVASGGQHHRLQRDDSIRRSPCAAEPRPFEVLRGAVSFDLYRLAVRTKVAMC